MQANAALTGAHEMVTGDLGPLAWVLDELRKSLDGAIRALHRFVRDAELARGLDLAALDASQLRIARQQLHQAVGALEMVGQPVPRCCVPWKRSPSGLSSGRSFAVMTPPKNWSGPALP